MIDGHNRYAICKKHSLPFETKEAQGLETELDVQEWMIRNQIARRNLTTIQKAEIALKLEEVERKKAKIRQLSTLKNNPESKIIDRPDLAEREDNGRALEKAAKAVGLGYETVRKTKQILEKAPEEVKQEVREGKVSIDRAYRNLQKQERIETLETAKFPDGKYRVIYADPPWQYGDERPPNHGGAVEHYPTMSITELCNMPIDTLTEDSAVLFLWTISQIDIVKESKNIKRKRSCFSFLYVEKRPTEM